MAKKVTTCSYCGKELKTNLLLGNEKLLSPADDILISCCPDCYRQREKEADKVHDQLTAKVKNYMRKHKMYGLIPDEQARPIYEQYLQDRAALQAGRENILPLKKGDFYQYDANGYFRWRESDISMDWNTTNNKYKTVKNGLVNDPDVYHRDDIQFIRYRVSSHQALDMFHHACTVDVCVNEMDTISAKPQTVRFVVVTKGLHLSFTKKACEDAARQVEAFRKAIGSDLPIERVKKFF